MSRPAWSGVAKQPHPGKLRPGEDGSFDASGEICRVASGSGRDDRRGGRSGSGRRVQRMPGDRGAPDRRGCDEGNRHCHRAPAAPRIEPHAAVEPEDPPPAGRPARRQARRSQTSVAGGGASTDDDGEGVVARRCDVRLLAFASGSAYGTRNWDRRGSAGLCVSRGKPGDRFGGDTMTMMDSAMDALRATGATVLEALGLNRRASEVRSAGGLTSAAEGSDSIMVAGSPGRRVAGSPGRRVAGSPGRRVAGSPGRRVAGSPGRRVAGSPGRRVAGSPPGRRAAGPPGRRAAGSPGRPTCVCIMGPLSPSSLPA